VTEEFQYGGMLFKIDTTTVGNKYDWAVQTPDGVRHPNFDETAPSQEVALEEARDWARYYARTHKTE